MSRQRCHGQATLPGVPERPTPTGAPLTWHPSHAREDIAAAAGLPACARCRACGVSDEGARAAELLPLPCPGNPWGSLDRDASTDGSEP
jgi:hypothetical protein